MPKLKLRQHSSSQLKSKSKKRRLTIKSNKVQKLLKQHLNKMLRPLMLTKLRKNSASQRKRLKNANLAKKRSNNVSTKQNQSRKRLVPLTTLLLKSKLLSKK